MKIHNGQLLQDQLGLKVQYLDLVEPYKLLEWIGLKEIAVKCQMVLTMC